MISLLLFLLLVLTVASACCLLEACYEDEPAQWLAGAGVCFVVMLAVIWAIWAMS